MSIPARILSRWHDLPAEVRSDQIARFHTLYRELYPKLRIYVFDARRVFSSPLTMRRATGPMAMPAAR